MKTNEILARIGVDPGQLGSLPDALVWLHRAGFPATKATFYKAQMGDDGCARFLFANRSVYRAGDVIEWALQRTVRPENGGQRRAARTRRETAQQNRVAA